jgi:hypothetical protein
MNSYSLKGDRAQNLEMNADLYLDLLIFRMGVDQKEITSTPLRSGAEGFANLP